MEVGELAPQFRKRLGWKEHHPERNGTPSPVDWWMVVEGPTTSRRACIFLIFSITLTGRTLDVWRSRTLKLTAEAKRQLFSSAKLWGLQVITKLIISHSRVVQDIGRLTGSWESFECTQVRATDGEEGEDSATETEYKVPKARKLRSHHAAKRSSIVCDLAITDIQVDTPSQRTM
jgi:hypothetical protein